ICCGNDGARRAIILLKQYRCCVRKLPLEFEQILKPCPAPCVNTLIQVRNSADIFCLSRQKARFFIPIPCARYALFTETHSLFRVRLSRKTITLCPRNSGQYATWRHITHVEIHDNFLKSANTVVTIPNGKSGRDTGFICKRDRKNMSCGLPSLYKISDAMRDRPCFPSTCPCNDE